jgi:tRNA pseudouridine32 synthase / 23S rRNA pseudouridine746 synthase
VLPILFQDSRFVVLDKPAGLPVHPGPGGGPSVEDWFPLLSRRRDGPWLAHRLDADTSGCLVVALRRAALHAAQAAFASGQAGKVYWAVVQGRPHADSGVIDAPLSKRNDRTGWRMAIDPAGAAAATEWRILKAATPGPDPGFTCLELRPRTGRTHQIRVHCAHLGCPILGDPVYGDGRGRLQLLARSIMLPLSPPLCATAPPPAHMIAALAACGL